MAVIPPSASSSGALEVRVASGWGSRQACLCRQAQPQLQLLYPAGQQPASLSRRPQGAAPARMPALGLGHPLQQRPCGRARRFGGARALARRSASSRLPACACPLFFFRDASIVSYHMASYRHAVDSSGGGHCEGDRCQRGAAHPGVRGAHPEVGGRPAVTAVVAARCWRICVCMCGVGESGGCMPGAGSPQQGRRAVAWLP